MDLPTLGQGGAGTGAKISPHGPTSSPPTPFRKPSDPSGGQAHAWPGWRRPGRPSAIWEAAATPSEVSPTQRRAAVSRNESPRGKGLSTPRLPHTGPRGRPCSWQEALQLAEAQLCGAWAGLSHTCRALCAQGGGACSALGTKGSSNNSLKPGSGGGVSDHAWGCLGLGSKAAPGRAATLDNLCPSPQKPATKLQSKHTSLKHNDNLRGPSLLPQPCSPEPPHLWLLLPAPC